MGYEEFLQHVGKMIERQLQEWDENYEVNIMKMENYLFVVKNRDKSYWVEITEKELIELQNRSPYSLDYKIWTMLAVQGIEIKFHSGDYLLKVYGLFGK